MGKNWVQHGATGKKKRLIGFSLVYDSMIKIHSLLFNFQSADHHPGTSETIVELSGSPQAFLVCASKNALYLSISAFTAQNSVS